MDALGGVCTWRYSKDYDHGECGEAEQRSLRCETILASAERLAH